MKEEEKIVDYLQRVGVKNEVIVNKVVRLLTSKYDTKVSSIEESKHLNIFSMDELFGSLSAYEMRTIGEMSKREVAFNTT